MAGQGWEDSTMAEQVRIFDTTLRDGEQSPGFSLRVSEKLLLAHQLDQLGVDIIEAGFPIASPADAESVRRVSTEIRRPVIACLARCHPRISRRPRGPFSRRRAVASTPSSRRRTCT